MPIVRTLDHKFYIVEEAALEGKEVPRDKIEGLPESLPEPPDSGLDEVKGRHHHHHWYNWHNHHWHDHHHHHHGH